MSACTRSASPIEPGRPAGRAGRRRRRCHASSAVRPRRHSRPAPRSPCERDLERHGVIGRQSAGAVLGGANEDVVAVHRADAPRERLPDALDRAAMVVDLVVVVDLDQQLRGPRYRGCVLRGEVVDPERGKGGDEAPIGFQPRWRTLRLNMLRAAPPPNECPAKPTRVRSTIEHVCQVLDGLVEAGPQLVIPQQRIERRDQQIW